ncbi:hypothetical protein R3W88_030892 [Solanum pinnatisectum]|uniref:Inosine/uridine-preferring nucleoside hydrolase domain-containing protein n=1 Tax=Solanum pinnatisectum TaxID=50273 RepID=A0AAV9LNF9_9SOLN|nr:hypothetical protein R3W88_030892 [Solanum pinnatisectum]
MAEEIKKIIIDTDPGIDDAIAIFVALQSPEIEVIGLTTIFGNLEVAGRTDTPVAEGSYVTITAIQLDPEFFKNVGQIVVLGGAFAVNGNVSPAAEANIFKDPTAADIVFTSGADVLAVGLNITHQVVLTDSHRGELAKSNGKFAKYLSKILDVYFDYHHTAYNTRGVFLHDPTALLASLITYSEGVVRVQTVGITKGLTIFYNKQKRFVEVTEWSEKPSVKVAVTVDAPKVIELVMA